MNKSREFDVDYIFKMDEFIDVLIEVQGNKTQLEFSQETGLNNATLSRLLNGVRTKRPHKSTVDKLAKTVDDPDLLKKLYEVTGYCMPAKSPHVSFSRGDDNEPPQSHLTDIHEKFFFALMKELSRMKEECGIEWILKKGTVSSYDYMIELKNDNYDFDFWYIRYLDMATNNLEREEKINNALGEFARIDLQGDLKVSCVTASGEDYDYFLNIQPHRLLATASLILFDYENGLFENETFLNTSVENETVNNGYFINSAQP